MAGNLRAFLAEFLGTFAVVLIGAGALCADFLSGGKIGLTGVALGQGLILVAAMEAFGPVSGGHFNPAITIPSFFFGRLDAIKTVFFVVSQLLGATAACFLLKAVLHGHAALLEARPFLGECALSPDIGYKAGTAIEAIGTFFLASCYVGGGTRTAGMLGPLATGFVWSAFILLAGTWTGGALNPARAFGPAIATGHWAYNYVYWIGPLFGGFAAFSLYEILHPTKKK